MLTALRRGPAPLSAAAACLERAAPRWLHHETSSPVAQHFVFVLGEPGAGKSTQCSKLVKEFGFSHLSAGELLRTAIHDGSVPNSQTLASTIDGGGIVPAHVRARGSLPRWCAGQMQACLRKLARARGACSQLWQPHTSQPHSHAGDGIAAAKGDARPGPAGVPHRWLPPQRREPRHLDGAGQAHPRSRADPARAGGRAAGAPAGAGGRPQR